MAKPLSIRTHYNVKRENNMKHTLSMLCLFSMFCFSVSFSDVELASFTGVADSQKISLRWITVTEVNNYGFNIERRDSAAVSWDSIGFVTGQGTTGNPHEYNLIDSSLSSGLHYFYRLKQINNDRSFKYSLPVEVMLTTTTTLVSNSGVIINYRLNLQNYPNPFNPSTIITFALMKQTTISLKIYDNLGRQITLLFSGNLSKGRHYYEWHANSAASGIYYCRLEGENINYTHKLILQK